MPKRLFQTICQLLFLLNIISQPLLFCLIGKRVGNATIDGFEKGSKKSQKTIRNLKFPMFTDPDHDLDTILRVSNLTMILTP